MIRGRYKGDSAVFVATDRRVIFLNHKPFFKVNDELSYDMVGGVSFNPQGRFAGVVVHTKVGEYSFRFVNRINAEKFVAYVESRVLEHSKNGFSPERQPQTTNQLNKTASPITQEARLFLLSRNSAVLSTANQAGEVAGAVVHYVLTPDDLFYCVSKEQTKKSRNIQTNHQVALTVYDDSTRITAQIQGVAEVETNAIKARQVLEQIIKPRAYDGTVDWPPITKLAAGQYSVIRIMPTNVKYTDFKK